ncbi:MAG: Ig-like domain-containing protein, partial [bacterium]
LTEIRDDDTPNLVNDLDLHIFGPDGTYYAWTLDPQNPTIPASQDHENYRDNVEQVYIESPAEGSYAVWIDGQINLGSQQEFTLCITGLDWSSDTRRVIHTKINAPRDGDIIWGEIPISARAFDNVGLSRLTVEVDGVVVDSPDTDIIDGEIVFSPPRSETAETVRWDTTAVANGTHTIRVTANSADGMEHSRSIDVFVFNEDEVTPLTLNGLPETGRIWPEGDESWFTFRTPYSATYTIQTLPAWDSPAMDTVITLFGPDNKETEITVSDDWGTDILSRITRSLEGNHAYYVKVTGYSDSTGFYGISLSTTTNENAPQIIPIPVNGPKVSSEGAGNGEEHWYSFTTDILGTHLITATPAPGLSSPSLWFTLYDSDAEITLAASIRGNHSTLSVVLPENQTFLVRAEILKGSPKLYLIGVETEASGPSVTLSPGNPRHAGHFYSPETGENWYVLDAPEPDERMIIELSPVSGQFTDGPTLTLYGSDNPCVEILARFPRAQRLDPSIVDPPGFLSPALGGRTFFVKVAPNGWSGSYVINASPVESLPDPFTINREFSSNHYKPDEPLTVTLTLELTVDPETYPSWRFVPAFMRLVQFIPPDWKVRNVVRSDGWPELYLDSWDRYTFFTVQVLHEPGDTFTCQFDLIPSEQAEGTYFLQGYAECRALDMSTAVIVTGDSVLAEEGDTAVESWRRH